MSHVRFVLNQEKTAIPELAEGQRTRKIATAELTTVTGLPDGTVGKQPTVALIGKTADGTVIYMQATLRVMQTAMAGFAAAYGDVTGGAKGAVLGAEGIIEWGDGS